MKWLLLISASLLIGQIGVTQNRVTQDPYKVHSVNGPLDIKTIIWSAANVSIINAAKPNIDFNSIGKWQRIGEHFSISDNGKWFAYTIESGSRVGSDSNKKIDSVIVESKDEKHRFAFAESSPGFFSDDNTQYVFMRGNTLCFLNIASGQCQYIKNVISFQMPTKNKRWFCYQLDNKNRSLVLYDMYLKKTKHFVGVSKFEFDYNGEWLILEKDLDTEYALRTLQLYNVSSGKEQAVSDVANFLFSSQRQAILITTIQRSHNKISLLYINFRESLQKVIWSTECDKVKISMCVMDTAGKQVAFNAVANQTLNQTVWYFRVGMLKAVKSITNKCADINRCFQIAGLHSFTENGRYIKFYLEQATYTRSHINQVQLEVWSYKDLLLQSNQRQQMKEFSLFNVETGLIINIEENGKSLCEVDGDFAIVKRKPELIYGDRFWEISGSNNDSNWIVSLKDNKWNLLPSKFGHNTDLFWFSPEKKYLVFFDADSGGHYFRYDVKTHNIINISRNVPKFQLCNSSMFHNPSEKTVVPIGIAAWIENDGLLVYDEYDIWQLDLKTQKNAVNLTNGYGHSNGIVFSLINSERGNSEAVPIVDNNESLLLQAFNRNNKENGFYRQIFDYRVDPELLSMGKYFLNLIPFCQDPNLSKKGMKLIKEKDGKSWILLRQSEYDAPNYYETTDFKSFSRLTDFQPQKKYNWMSEELHSFKHLNGKIGEGLLFKPENFDSTKRYPVIIVFYGKYSSNLHQFLDPMYNWNAIAPGQSPIWLLSNEYLVFTPDIYVSAFKYGPEALDVIEGAITYLSTLSYVEPKKIGCASHSWSAKLGAYIFTHSKSVSATAISEGFLYANMINVAFSTYEDGTSKLKEVEIDFEFGNPWENRETWLDQTTVLNVDKATTPLLLFANKQSSHEYVNQTLQFFTSLRRLDKKVWWLKYDKGGHTLDDLDEQKDYTIRYTQYFDHFLKDAPAPRWMTRGIPATMKGIDMGYELDPSGTCALDKNKDCSICQKWNEQYKRTPEMFAKPIAEWQLDADLVRELKNEQAAKNEQQKASAIPLEHTEK